jgi:hypothetical protein
MSKKRFTSSRAFQFGTNGTHHFEAAFQPLHCTTPILISDSARPSGAQSNIFHHNAVWCPIKESPNLIDSIAGLEKTS